jgi:hypothetical protein
MIQKGIDLRLELAVKSDELGNHSTLAKGSEVVKDFPGLEPAFDEFETQGLAVMGDSKYSLYTIDYQILSPSNKWVYIQLWARRDGGLCIWVHLT